MFNLFRKFALSCLALFCAVFIPAFIVLPHAAQATFIKHQSLKSNEISTLFLNVLAPEVEQVLRQTADLNAAELSAHPDVATLGSAVQTLMHGSDVVKVKLYNLAGLTVYASERGEIGALEVVNAGVQQALSAQLASELIHYDSVGTFERDHADLDILGTYSPVQDARGQVVGVLALYSDVTLLLKEHRTQLITLILIALLFTLLLYTGMLFMVRWLDGVLRQQYTALTVANTVLEQQKEELARSNSELEQFAYTASHDLQEPLRKIQAFGDRLARKYGDALGEDGRMSLDRMQNASERMRGLIQDLLSFSRISSKGNPFVAVDLNETVAGVVADLEVRIAQSGGRVDTGSLPTIDADPLQMRQLLQNLIGNALKFAKPTTPPVVKVQALVRGDSVQLSVEDDGIGFDAQYAAKVFEVFQRLHGRGEYEGTGMGLAIVRKIAERHGGTAKAFSEAGKGATFVVTLPLKQAKDESKLNLFSTQDISELRQGSASAIPATTNSL